MRIILHSLIKSKRRGRWATSLFSISLQTTFNCIKIFLWTCFFLVPFLKGNVSRIVVPYRFVHVSYPNTSPSNKISGRAIRVLACRTGTVLPPPPLQTTEWNTRWQACPARTSRQRDNFVLLFIFVKNKEGKSWEKPGEDITTCLVFLFTQKQSIQFYRFLFAAAVGHFQDARSRPRHMPNGSFFLIPFPLEIHVPRCNFGANFVVFV